MTGKDIRKTADIVFDILTEFPYTRNSDDDLYVKVCEIVNPEALSEPFWYVHSNIGELNLPKFETVRRSRQKIQADNPELASNVTVAALRKGNELVYKEFATEKM